MKRLSPSLAVSLLALFVALGGSGYAAVRVNGRTIVARSIPGSKLKHNTLTGVQINESRLGQVPSAADSDFLDGRPAGAYVLADGGTAAVAKQALQLDGLSASAFLPAGGTAVNASALGGQPASAFLGAGATAVNAAKLDGLDSSAFAPASRVQGAGPVAVTMPGTPGQTVTTILAGDGALTLVGQCTNNAGVPNAAVGVVSSADLFLSVGEADTHTTNPLLAGPPFHAIAQAAPSGGQWDTASHTFSAVTDPASASDALQGAATAIVDNGTLKRCYEAGWAFAS